MPSVRLVTSIDASATARARLRGLGSAPWGGPDDVDLAPPAAPLPVAPPVAASLRSSSAAPPGRFGWPPAAPGTPAARLRLDDPPGPPAWHGPRWGDGAGPDDDSDDSGDPDDVEEGAGRPGATGGDGWVTRARASAWDAAAQRGGRWSDRWLPAAWRDARWDPGRTGALALAVVTALAAVVAAVGVWRDRPVSETVPALPAISSPAPPLAGGLALPGGGVPVAVPRGGPIVVSVAGRVGRPGLVRLPEGARVGDALEAAGGAARGVDLTGLNLAQRLTDGEQVVVGVRMPAPAAGAAPGGGVMGAGGGVMGAGGPATGAGGGPAGAGGAPSGGAGGGRLDLNAATLEQLDQLPGVGPVTAQKILDWRTEHGRFAAIEQLQEVGGIGEARFATLRSRVRV